MTRTLLILAGLALAPACHAQGGPGGLDFGSALVAENFSGASPRHTQQASLLPGRAVADTDPAHVRSGQSSIRLQVQPGDCGARIGGGAPDDCANGNERVEINAGSSSGTALYAFSLQLGPDFRQLNRNAPAVELVQWFQADAGACFALRYEAGRGLQVRNRCPDGNYNTAEPRDTGLRADPFGGFREFVVLANWSKGADGLFRVLVDGRLAFSFSGPTLAASGGDEVSERFSILRLGGLGQHRAASTLWLDDVITAGGLEAIEARYAFDRAELGVR